MGFLSEVWALATETPYEREKRLREQGAVTRRKLAQTQTSHPDDAGHSGLDKYSQKKRPR